MSADINRPNQLTVCKTAENAHFIRLLYKIAILEKKDVTASNPFETPEKKVSTTAFI